MSDYKYTRAEAYKLYRKNPQEFFDKIIHTDADNESKLINKDWPLFWTHYHYNLVENGIMEMVVKHDLPVKGASILDIGVGTGHWLEFYTTYFEPSQLWGVDFAPGPLEKLEDIFSSRVRFQQWDISETIPDCLKSIRFDIVNAIGIIFHIVDDRKWETAIRNLSSLLKENGILIIGGDFGNVTKDRGVMRKTRSLLNWQTLANNLDLNILDIKRYDWWAGADQGGLTDNLLALGKFRKADG